MTPSSSTMRVRVELFASLREAVGEEELIVEAPVGARVRDVVELVSRDHEALRGRPFATARNMEYCPPDAEVSPDDRIALIPPVSGG